MQPLPDRRGFSILVQDGWTIATKEWKEMFMRRGGLRAGIIPMLMFPVGLMGIFLPLQTGPEWTGLTGFLCLGIWLPQLLVLSIVADTFAGERERHTLETLLATRLSDTAILAGKLLAIIGYACGMSLLSAISAVISLNAYNGFSSPWIVYRSDTAAAALIFAFLTSGFAAGLGILISLRAPTVRQAQQTLSMITLGLTFGIVFLIGALPERWKSALLAWSRSQEMVTQVFGIIVILTILNGLLFLAAKARFQRDRLILD